MFGQNNDDKQEDQNSMSSVVPSTNPAPGAPVGPLTDDPSTSFGPSPANTGSIGAAVPDDLLAIKQDALQQLTPLVGHLEQTPEEKFRTTMMMIQAADDHSLVKAAYEAAKEIPDEKIRAQALLDVVNEINYFTQHHEK